MFPESRKPILIVEDNFETRQILERLLGVRGYRAVSVGNGLAALDYLRAGGASVIILDIRLPGIDGHAVLDELRRDPHLAAIPVVVYSAEPGGVTDVAACLRKASTDPDVLLDAIATCLLEEPRTIH